MTRTIAYRIINSCAPRPFTGNPICVFAEEPPEALMQPLATQMNLACSVFPVRTGDRSYRMRLFTSECEVGYAGSPTLAAAWSLGQGRWTQTTSGATAEVEVTGDMAWMEQPEPSFEEIEDDDVIAGLGLQTVDRLVLCRVASNRYVVAVTRDDPANFKPLQNVLLRPALRFGPALVGAVRRVNEGEIHARFFGPAHGVPEDPACGAVAGSVATLMHRYFGTARDVTLRQGEEMGRPSRILVALGQGSIKVGGRQIPMGEGHVTLEQGTEDIGIG